MRKLRIFATVLLALTLLLAVAVLLFGGFDATFTPALSFAPLTPALIAYGILLLLPVLLHLKEAVLWHILRSKI